MKNNAYRISRGAGEIALCVLLLLLTVGILGYYVSGPALAALHADCTDSLLWAQASLESGTILSEDFSYAALLPFGGSLWMVPILQVFGYGITAYVLSQIVFVLIFVASAFFLLRTFRFGRAAAAGGTFCLSMLLSGSQKLLEIMWGHVIYYSLSILFWMLLLAFTVRLMDCLKKWRLREKLPKRAVFNAVCLLFLCIGCATDGFQMISVSVIPMAAALAALVLFEKGSLVGGKAVKRYAVAAVMVIGTGIGLVLLSVITGFGKIQAPYESGYSAWDYPKEWTDNLLALIPHFVKLFGVDVKGREPLFKLDSIIHMIRILCLVVILASPALMLIRYGKLRRNREKVALWSYWVVTAVILFAFIFGMLNSANWRLTPILGAAIVMTLLYLRELFHGGEAEKRISVLLTCLLLLVACVNARNIMKMPARVSENEHWQLAQVLASKGYDRGYATFWNANDVTLLSDSAVQVSSVKIDEGELVVYNYQNRKSDFDDQPGQEDYFLLLEKTEYDSLQGGDYWKWLNQTRSLIDQFEYYDYVILVYDGNPVAPEMQP